MKYWFDTEFIENGHTIDLISIGIVSEDGRTYYAQSSECDHSKACEWVRKNVLIHLNNDCKPRKVIAKEIIEFVDDDPEFWAYYADYDWVALCQLYGRMIDLPAGWPMYCKDLKQYADAHKIDLIEQTNNQHNALDDAKWIKQAYESVLLGTSGRFS